MAVPDFQSLMLPLLGKMADGQMHSITEMVEALAGELLLTEEDRNELIPSNRQTKFYNRVSWAHIYLARAGLLERQRRGIYRVTERGVRVLSDKPLRLALTLKISTLRSC